MSTLKKFILITSIALMSSSNVYSEIPHFIDFKYIMNKSKAGEQA